MMLLAVENLCFNYTDKPLLKDVSLYLNEGEKIGLIGVNGSGTSTLIDFLINIIIIYFLYLKLIIVLYKFN